MVMGVFLDVTPEEYDNYTGNLQPVSKDPELGNRCDSPQHPASSPIWPRRQLERDDSSASLDQYIKLDLRKP
jgi:hypothetical protein